MGDAGGLRVESVHRQKAGLMFEAAADHSSILAIDLGIMLGMIVMVRLLDPSSMRARILLGSTVARCW
jgi:hypothetical protein